MASLTDVEGTDDEETAGLLALMLLHHARPARTRQDGSLVPLAEQDRSRWDTALIAEGVAVLQAALRRDRLGEFQAQAAIAALHADAPRAEETDWVQIVGWYDDLLRLTGARSWRSTGPSRSARPTGLRPNSRPWPAWTPACPATAASAYLHERRATCRRGGYADAARSAPTSPNVTTSPGSGADQPSAAG